MEKLNDFGYIDYAVANIRKVADEQADNIRKAAALMADAIANDKLINVYAGGGHTTLAMGEMFFRAGGLANINPLMETALSVFNQALKYLELERTENFGASIIKYYDIQKDDLVIIFHNIGINPATIDAAMEIKKRGGKIIAVASSHWQNEMPADHFIRHSSGSSSMFGHVYGSAPLASRNAVIASSADPTTNIRALEHPSDSCTSYPRSTSMDIASKIPL